MNILKQLIARRGELQQLFDTQTQIENQARDEKLRLQGEARVLDSLIKQNDTSKKEEK
jgi:hypothetical protein